MFETDEMPIWAQIESKRSSVTVPNSSIPLDVLRKYSSSKPVSELKDEERDNPPCSSDKQRG